MTLRGPGRGPLFPFKDIRPLTRQRLVSRMREDRHRYSGHSFRIGAATTVACRGMQDSLIKIMGRWESVVSAVCENPMESAGGSGFDSSKKGLVSFKLYVWL